MPAGGASPAGRKEVRISSHVRRLLAGILSLSVPGLIGADLINTASVSYRGPTGALFTSTSNTVVVTVAAVPPLQAPVIVGFASFPQDLQADDTLTLILSGGPPDSVNWVFTPGTPAPGSSFASATALAGTTFSVMTAVPSLTLSAVTQLTPGPWHVSVTAVNSTGTSAPVQADFVLVQDTLSSIQVYPDPWRSDKHTGIPITFDQLSGQVTLKIFTVSARLVRTLGPAGGKVTWDLTNNSGEKVASGLYLYLITDNQGNKTRGKFAIIR